MSECYFLFSEKLDSGIVVTLSDLCGSGSDVWHDNWINQSWQQDRLAWGTISTV